MVFFLVSGVLLWVSLLAPQALAVPLQFPADYPQITWANAPQAFTPAQTYTLQDIVNIIGQIRNFILIVGIIVVLVFLIWGGITYMTSGGNATKITAAKQRIVAAIIGAAIVIGAFAILATIRGILEHRSLLGPGGGGGTTF